MTWRCEEPRYQQRWKCPISPGTNLSIRKVFKDYFSNSICILHWDWYSRLQFISIIQRHINCLSDIKIVIIKSFATFNDTHCQQLNVFSCSLRSYPSQWLKCFILGVQCLYMISMITNCEIEIDGKNPHFTKLQISQWSTVDRRRCGNAQALSLMKY